MEKVQYKIGIVNDDRTKITQLLTQLHLCCNSYEGQPKKEKYADYELIPVELQLLPLVEDMAHSIIESGIDGIIIDYNLSSQEAIAYTGVMLANEIVKVAPNLPLFVLTAYQDDLFEHELFNTYLVFEFQRYIGEEDERIELNCKLIEQIKKSRADLASWEKEMEALLPQRGHSAAIDERILELDTILEKSANGYHVISPKLKRELSAERIDKIIEKLDLLMESKDND